MGFILRFEAKAIQELIKNEKAASKESSNTFAAFQENLEETAVKEAPDLGASLVSGGSTSTATDSSTEESDTGSDDGDISDDFSFDGDDSEDTDDTEEEDPKDDSEDTEKEDEEKDKSDDDTEKKENEDSELKKESFRTLNFLPGIDDRQLKMESIFAGQVDGFNVTGWSGTAFVAGALATVGIRFSAMLFSGLFKIVLFTFAKTFSILNNLFNEAESCLTRYLRNTERQRTTLKTLKIALEELKTKGATLPEDASINVYIGSLTTPESEDINNNVKDYILFLNRKIDLFQKAILSDFNNLKVIAENGYLRKNFDSMGSMSISPSSFGFINDQGGSEENVSIFSMEPMIGGAQLLAKLPDSRFDTWDEVEKAYNNSSVYITLIKSTAYKSKPMELGDLEDFLNNLEILTEASLKRQSFYNEITKCRTGVINSVKQLFVRLCEETVKVSFKNSVALPLHLKSSFVTKVYMTGAMDLHDHTARVIANGLSYVDTMLKVYRTDTKK